MPPLRRVALLIETSSAYGREVLAGINQYARLNGPWAFYLEPGGLEQAPPLLEGWGAEGIIARIHTEEQADLIERLGLPTVDLEYAFTQRFPKWVSNNDLKIGRACARHLIDCGLESFAFCGWGATPEQAMPWERRRAEAFTELIASKGFPAAQYIWPKRKADHVWAKEQAFLSRWLEKLPKPVGIMASDDQRGRHILTVAQIAGLRVPHDVAVVGVDNDELLCELSCPPLSSIALRTEKVGYEAARILDGLMQGDGQTPKPVVVDPIGLVPRQSTDTLALADEHTCAAIRWIRSNAHKGIRVLDVLDVVPISRKTLEVGIKKAIGRTPHEEIQRVRIERIKQLLVQTDWPLKRIAADCGFANPEHMHAVFRRDTGHTPKKYRVMRRGG